MNLSLKRKYYLTNNNIYKFYLSSINCIVLISRARSNPNELVVTLYIFATYVCLCFVVLVIETKFGCCPSDCNIAIFFVNFFRRWRCGIRDLRFFKHRGSIVYSSCGDVVMTDDVAVSSIRIGKNTEISNYLALVIVVPIDPISTNPVDRFSLNSNIWMRWFSSPSHLFSNAESSTSNGEQLSFIGDYIVPDGDGSLLFEERKTVVFLLTNIDTCRTNEKDDDCYALCWVCQKRKQTYW